MDMCDTEIRDWTIEDRGAVLDQDRYIIRYKGEFVTTHVTYRGCEQFIGRRLAS